MIDTLFYVMLTEAVLGGGGRTFSVGPVTLRMVLFGVCLITWLGVAFTSGGRRDGQATALTLVLLFLISLIPALSADAAAGSEYGQIAAEIVPLLFWLMAPFIAMSLQTVQSVERAGKIILYGGVAVAIVTTAVMAALQTGILNFGTVYFWANDTKELFFRSLVTFFYKGHFFVGIAIIFCFSLRPPWWKTMGIILLVSLALSLTRGLYLAVMVAVALSFITSRRSAAVLGVLIVGLIVASIYGNLLVDVLFDPNRNNSAQVRSKDFIYFAATFDSSTLLLGDGAGTLLNGRQSIENSLLWALWRFGIVGVLFWLMPLFIALRYFRSVPFGDRNRNVASAFFYGVVMLYIVTLFNPFINNSIGLIYLLCAIFSLRRLGKDADTRAAMQRASHAG
jgi:hypothetical protein